MVPIYEYRMKNEWRVLFHCTSNTDKHLHCRSNEDKRL